MLASYVTPKPGFGIVGVGIAEGPGTKPAHVLRGRADAEDLIDCMSRHGHQRVVVNDHHGRRGPLLVSEIRVVGCDPRNASA